MPSVVVCRGVYAVVKAHVTRNLGKDDLVTHEEDHHFEVSANSPTVHLIFQDIIHGIDSIYSSLGYTD